MARKSCFLKQRRIYSVIVAIETGINGAAAESACAVSDNRAEDRYARARGK